MLLRRATLRRTVGMLLGPLRAGVAALRAGSVRAYIGPWVLRIVARGRALGRALRRATVPGRMLIRGRRVKVAAAVTASTSASATSWRALVLGLLRISVLRILLRVVGGRRAGGRRRRRRRELVLLGSRHGPSGLQQLAGGRAARGKVTDVWAVNKFAVKMLVMSGEVCNGPRWVN